MKKLSIFFAIAALFLASCSDISDGPDSVQLAGEKKVTVSLSLNNALARTIMPTSLTESDIDKVELTAEISTLGTYGKYSFGSSDSKTWESLGEAQESSFVLDIGTYNFTLNLYAQERIIQTKTIKDVEILESGTVLEFGTAEYAQNSGKLSLTFEWTTENLKNQLFDVKPGLYEFDEDGKIGTALIEPQLLTATTDDNKNYKATFAPEDEIPNGSYFLKVQIMSKEEEPGATPKVLNTITDIVKIKGYKTEKTIPLGLDKLNWSGKPAFEVSIKVDEESDIEVTDNLATLTNTELKFTASDDFSEYSWSLNGETSDTNVLEVDAGVWPTGIYEIYLRAKKGGEYYSYTAQIKWTRKFMVNFNTADHEEVEPQFFLEGGTERVQKPTLEPTYGWYLDGDFTQYYDFGTAPAPSSDLTLYACWNITKIHVSESGENGNGRGTEAKPLASLSAALDLIDDPSEDYTIYIDGTLIGAQELDESLDGKARSITLSGINGTDNEGNPKDSLAGGFSESSPGQTLTISTTVPVTITSLNITGGWAGSSVSGGGLLVAANADVTLDHICLIIGNHAESFGGGAAVYGKLTIMGECYIIENTSSEPNGGGGVYIAPGGTLDMQGGIIGNNELTDGHDNGVRVSGTMKIGGSAYVAQNNDVYLDSGKVIEITKIFDGDLTTAAVITPDDYTRTTALITGVSLEIECTAFKVTPQVTGDGTHMWRINEEGKLQESTDLDIICDQIRVMNTSDTVTVDCELSSEDVTQIAGALKSLYEKNNDVMVSLDMSGVTGLTVLPDAAFNVSYNLSEVTLPEGITSIPSEAFRSCEYLTTVNIPASVTEIYESAFANCPSISNVTLEDGNTTFKIEGDALYTNDGKRLLLYCTKTTEAPFELPASVEQICSNAFFGAQITGITFASSPALTRIGESAFHSCSNLTSIAIPDSVTVIEQDAFGFSNLSEGITLPANITEISTRCFCCCGFESITIPEGVEVIRYGAFLDCRNLKTITLPASLKSIGIDESDKEVFRCENLTTINYRGTEEEKAGITIYDENITDITWNCNYTGD